MLNNISTINFSSKNPFSAFTQKSNNSPAVKNLPDMTKFQPDKFIHNAKENKTSLPKVLILAAALVAGSIATHRLWRNSAVSAIIKSAKKERFDFSYIQTLAADMSKSLGKTIETKQLDSVMGKKELLSILPKMQNDNYVAYREIISGNNVIQRIFDTDNIQQGIFRIDLHSHTNHSDGVGTVADILDDVTKYANKLKEKTGADFIFSITDHDSISGTKEALRLIAENPEKYKNLRFVPGVELSFIHTTDRGTAEVSELLVHGINPYSEKTAAFIDALKTKRANMIQSSIRDLSEQMPGIKFSKEEVQGFFIDIPREMFKYNLHWRIYNYAHIKQRLSALAKKWGKDPEAIYKEILPQWHISRESKSPDSFEKFMLSRSVDLSKTQKFNPKIDMILQPYMSQIKDGRAVSSSERTFEEIIDEFRKDKNVVIGFAHPAFLAKQYDKPQAALAQFIKDSAGLLKTTEKYHQGYSIPIQKGVLSEEFVEQINQMLEKYKLLSVGGHDNHSRTFLN